MGQDMFVKRCPKFIVTGHTVALKKITILNVKQAFKCQKPFRLFSDSVNWGAARKTAQQKGVEKRGVGRRGFLKFVRSSHHASLARRFSRRASTKQSGNHQKHLRFGQSFSSLLSPQSFSWSHLRTASIQFPLSHVKSDDPQVAERVAIKESIILIKYRFFFIVQGTFGRGPSHTIGGVYIM